MTQVSFYWQMRSLERWRDCWLQAKHVASAAACDINRVSREANINVKAVNQVNALVFYILLK